VAEAGLDEVNNGQLEEVPQIASLSCTVFYAVGYFERLCYIYSM